MKKVLYTVMIIFYLVMFFFLAMPAGTAITDRVDPHILGLPCYQALVLYGSLLMAIGLMVWFLIECKIEDKERADEEATDEEATGEVNVNAE